MKQNTLGDYKLDVIQALRGIAALLVVFYHGVGYQPQSKEPGIEHVFSMIGASGVDLFFMISGFIMVYATRGSAGGFDDSATFLIKRVARVFPVYLVATALYVPMMLAMGNHVGHIDIMTQPSQILRSVLMIPTNFGSRAPYFGGSVLHVGWTINYEVYFYALFALSMMFGRLRWIALSAIAGALLLALPLLVSSPSLDAYVDYGFHGPLNFATNPMLWEFFIGVVIGRIYLTSFTISKTTAYLLAAVALSVLVWFLVNNVSPKFGLTGWGIPYAALLFVLTIGSKTMEFQWPRALVWTGNISFSLYLVHPFVIHPAYQLFWGETTAAFMNNVWFMLILASLSLAMAAVSHRYLEVGLSEWVRKRALSAFAAIRRPAAIAQPT
ncbi:acyltransferase family protein [Stenotrophomonas geniculata]|uniref:acyltransferase family protein n=1 Tax=Stenotrophomonas geniculata TaxID=86188 RepID=UPI002479E903|nr:acyltransferase [Stenotrophomonas geniculata]MDH7551892.1 acyltransferase [Stenotrophomonas geniculata]